MKNHLSVIFLAGVFIFSAQLASADQNQTIDQTKKDQTTVTKPQGPVQPEDEIADRGLAHDWIESRQPSYAQNENSTYFNRNYANTQPNSNLYYAQPSGGYNSYQSNYSNQGYDGTYNQGYYDQSSYQPYPYPYE